MNDAGLGFFSGLVNGFTQTQERMKQQAQDKKEKDAKLKLFEIQLEREQQANQVESQRQATRQQLFDKFSQPQAPNVQYPTDPYDLGQIQQYQQSIQPQKLSLSDMLADPQTAFQMMNSGMVDAKTVLASNEEARIARQMDSLLNIARGTDQPALPGTPGASGGPGISPSGRMEMTGLKFDTKGNPMLDFSRPQLAKEVPSADNKSMIQLDRNGRVMGSRPMAPGEKQVPTQTQGQKSTDEAFSKDYTDFKLAGGYTQIIKNAQNLDQAAAILDKGQVTGPWMSKIPDVVRPFVNPEGLIVKQKIEEAIQMNLRPSLGAAFTEKEGAGLMNRAFDERLSPEINAQRVRRLSLVIKEAAAAKKEASDYFEQNGTMTGFKGKLWTKADVEHAIFGSENKGGGKVINFSDLPP